MKKIASALLLSAAISAPAFAANAGTSYVSLDYGSWAMSQGTPFPNPGVLTLSGGYNFTPNWAAEVGLAIVGDSTVITFGNQTNTYAQSALKAAAVYTVPVNPQFDVFGKIGFDSISAKLTQSVPGFSVSYTGSTTNLMFGFGGKFNINNNMSIRLQYEALGKSNITTPIGTVTAGDITSTSIGFVYGF